MQIERAALKHLGKSYGHTGAQTTDCVRFAYDVLVDTFGWELRPEPMMLNGTGPWANIEHLAGAGKAREVVLPVPGRWHYVQSWSGLGPDGSITPASSGHCWLWYEGRDGEPSRILEATTGTHRWYREEDWATKIRRYTQVRLVVLPDGG